MTGRERAGDAAVAGLTLAATLFILAMGGFGAQDAGTRALDPLGVLLAAGTALPLLWRRDAPVPAFAAVAAATAALVALSYPLDVPVGSLPAAYALGATAGAEARSRDRWGSIALAVAFPATLVAAFAARGIDPGDVAPELAFWAVLLAGVWLAGDRARLRRAQLEALRERVRLTERDRERELRLAAAEERTRIARELHDSAGHAINVILVQAGAARLLQERDPASARRAVATIEDVARETIGEIDRLVHALRDGSDDVPPAFPADPDALERLVERHGAAGIAIRAGVRGDRRGLPSSVAWAAHRILQEALTNAARHGAGDADVDIAFGDSELQITVVNPTTPARGDEADGRDDGHGHGLTGMRERALLLGGTLEAGAEGDARFRLHARLPYAPAAA